MLNIIWPIYLRNTLSGQGLLAILSLSAIEQNDYITVKATPMATYHVSKVTYRKKVFDTIFSAGEPDAWFQDRQQVYKKWMQASGGSAEDTLLLELMLQKLPRWLKNRMRRLKSNMYEELKEAMTRYISTSKPKREPTLFTRPD